MTVCALWSGERTSAHRGMRFRRTRRDAEDVFRQVVPPHAAASSARFHAAPRWPALRDASEPTPSAPPRPHPHSGTPALPPRSSIRACRRPGRALSGTARRRGFAPARPGGGGEAADDILLSSSGLHPTDQAELCRARLGPGLCPGSARWRRRGGGRHPPFLVGPPPRHAGGVSPIGPGPVGPCASICWPGRRVIRFPQCMKWF